MKKLLGIVVLGLFICNLSYANTPVQQYVFEKLYDEYSKCTVYYKFLSRGVERKKDVAVLSEKEESFVKEMNILSEEAEKNMYFFSSKINVPNENVQSNIQNIYKTFLDIAGRDYSKTELLNDKYYTLCSKSLEDPKSRMIFWDSDFQKTKKNKNETLVGKKLNCFNGSSSKYYKKNKYSALEFLPNKKLKIYTINTGNTSNWNIDSDVFEYDTTPEKINVKLSTSFIDRESLSFFRWGKVSKCEIMPNDWKILEFLEFTLEKVISEQESKNKL